MPVLTPVVVRATYFDIVVPRFAGPAAVAIITSSSYVATMVPTPAGAPGGLLRIDFSGVHFVLLPTTSSEPLLVVYVPCEGESGPPDGPGVSIVPVSGFLLSFLCGRCVH